MSSLSSLKHHAEEDVGMPNGLSGSDYSKLDDDNLKFMFDKLVTTKYRSSSFHSMNSHILLEEMTFSEKIGLMEDLWNHISRDQGAFTPPGWHGEVLKIRKERIKSGEIGFTDWEVAKEEIRDRLS